MKSLKDSSITLNDLKDKVKLFCEARDWDQYHGAKDLSIGVITEASELLEHFRFKSEWEIDEMFSDQDKKHQISYEIADVLFFLIRLSQKYDIDLTQSFIEKLEINEKKYPISKFKGSNKKYTEL
jgi:NTP pyrophosphatase (non-canonical NTP hydrolase)